MAEFRWPDGNQCAVVLTFDMDGETIPFVYDAEHAKVRLALQSESAYGPTVGMPRILRTLSNHDINASFFIPGFTAERHPEILEQLLEQGHEIGHHGYLHERPDMLSDEDEEAVLQRGIEVLRRLTGKAPTGYRSPAWELKPSSPALLKKYGFVYDSSLMGDDIPYLIEAGDGSLVEIPIQWINDDWPHFGFCSVPPLGTGISSPQKVFEVWSEEFAGYHDEGLCYVLTMHPFVTGRPSRIRLLDRMIRFINEHDDVWWATLGEVADWAQTSGEATLRRSVHL